MRPLISIHDVMPETLDKVGEHIAALRAEGHEAFTLLVVPGRQWMHEDLARLARWQLEGLELAAHGWHHHAARLGGPYHWLHAALLSRRAAEHLGLSAAAISRLMADAAEWFTERGLSRPTTYVPPAWAVGRVGASQLRKLPYRRIEVTRGLLRPADRYVEPLPLVGFEADTAVREHFLRAWNRRQQTRAQRGDQPLRIAIHPYDDELRLAGELNRLIRRHEPSQRYGDYWP